jgi:peptidoglycan/xylan/chitin deacetylase (PgdA/CDA1 family)
MGDGIQRTAVWGRPLLAGTGALAALSWAAPLPRWLRAASLAGAAAAAGVGLFWPPAGTFARPIIGVEPRVAGDRFALSFDDGPDGECTPRVLDLLDERRQRATFFVIGRNADRHLALVGEIARRGHELGNHSYTHSRLTAFSTDRLAAQLERTSALIESAAGRRPRWYRPPAGLLFPTVVEAVRRSGLELVAWSTSAHDGTKAMSARRATARLLDGLRPGAILVLHDGIERGYRELISTEVLPRVLDAAERRGLRSVPLTELIG